MDKPTVAELCMGAGVEALAREAVPLDEFGWHTIEITAAKRGQMWSTRRLKREWLTLNRPPAIRVAEQCQLFAAGS